VPAYEEPSVPKDCLKSKNTLILVYSRTLYFQDVPSHFTSASLRQRIEGFGRVESCRVNPVKQNAFLKIATRKEAEVVRERMNGERLGPKPLKVQYFDVGRMGLRVWSSRTFQLH
jgi:RNA recognition motif-containing protein